MRPAADMVRDAIARAKENGYDLDDWSEWEVAVDLCDFDSDFEKFDVADVYEIVCLVRNSPTGASGTA